jgi:hypothetical protein
MVTIRKFTQYLVAIGIASLLFSATLVSENTKFFLFSQNENPFDQAIQLDDVVTVGAEEKGKELLSPVGEFLIVFPESKLDFSDGKRNMETGDVFYSSLFLHPDVQEADGHSSDVAEGHFRIGDIVLHAPQSSVFIHRDEDFQQTEIYTWGHSVELSWEGLSYPFIVPAHTKVHIDDTFLSTVQNKSYEEQKQALGWEAFDQASIDTPTSPAKEKMNLGISRLAKQQKRINKLVLFAPQVWDHTGPKTHIFGRFQRSIGIFQDRFAIGLSRTRDNQREFLSFVSPFIKANELIRNRRTALGGRTLQQFKTITRSVAWKHLLQKDPDIAYQWNTFFMAHNAWMQNGFDEESQDFLKTWNSIDEKTPMENIPRIFFSFEKLVARGLLKRSRQELETLKSTFEQVTFSQENAQEVTNFRRILENYLERETLLQNENSFEFFALLVKLETELYEDPKVLNEIKIEVVHQIFPFLKTFLEDQTKIELSQILLQLYQELSFETLVAQEGTQILTEEEQELVSFLVLLGNTGLTAEEIRLIKEENELQKLIGEQIDNVQEQNEPETEEVVDSGQLRNAKYLNELLESIGVPTEPIYFSTNRKEGITTFRGGRWKGFSLSGTFYYPTQFFLTLNVGNRTKENFHARFLGSFLLQVETTSGVSSTQEAVFISQTTPQAILERKLLQELLALYSFEVAREDILILDAEMSHFRVSDARLDGRHITNFIYNRDDKVLESLELKLRDEDAFYKNEVFPLKSAPEILRERILESMEQR